MIGKHLSHYLIESELGRGGMGIVYRAQDTKLDRTVAIKILPSSALASDDDRARFYREAKAAAQLHHPNIASVFEIDEAVPEDGDSAEPRPFIAMEFISGGTLHELVQKGPLPLSDAVKITSQVAEALKAAHGKDIVHRDIKSANVMITVDGVAKVLDFGLAKTNQSTMLTRMGSTLGTVYYMSPEQARGQEVDGRTDLYSLGTMLYEMVAGRLPYAGEYEQAIVYSILNEPPEPLTSLRTGVPMQLEWIVNKLLAKEADYRYQTAADLLADLKSVDLSGSGLSMRSMPAMSTAAAGGAGPAPRRALSPRLIAIGVALMLVSGLIGWFLRSAPTERPAFSAPALTTIDLDGARYYNGMRVSENGQFMAFVGVPEGEADSGIILRDLVNGSERSFGNVAFFSQIAFSPDARWLVYVDEDGLWKVPTAGGSPVQIEEDCFWPVFLDGSNLTCEFFLPGGGPTKLISLEGDRSDIVLEPDSTQDYLRLSVIQSLGDERRVLLNIRQTEGGTVGIGNVEDGSYRVILPQAVFARYVDPGFLVFIQGGEGQGVLMVRPFDLASEEFTGPAMPVQEDPVHWNRFDITRSGIMIALAGPIENSEQRLGWFGMDGQLIEYLDFATRPYDNPAISPDGRLIAVEVEGESEEDTWILDVQTGNDYRLTFTGDGNEPAWSPDGTRIYFASDIDSDQEVLLVKPADNSGTTTRVLGGIFDIAHPSLSGEKNLISYQDISGGESDVVVRSLEDSLQVRVLERPNVQYSAALSRNGDYVAFVTHEQGEQELYVQRVDGDAFWTVSEPSNQNPSRPQWSPDGNWLYYRDRGQLWRTRVYYEPTFRRDRPEQVLQVRVGNIDFDLHPDGERILINSIYQEGTAQNEEITSIGMRVNLVTLFEQLTRAGQ